MKRALLLVLVALATVAGALLLWEMRSVVLLLVAAIALGAAVRPAAEKMTAIGLPRALSMLVMVLVTFLLVVGGILLLGYALGEEMPTLLRDVQSRTALLRTEWADGNTWQRAVAENIPAPVTLDQVVSSLDALLAPEAAPATDAAPAAENIIETPVIATTATARDEAAAAMLRLMLGATGSVAGFIGQFVILVFLSLYWSLEHEWFERLWISLLPAQQRQPARATWRAVEANVGAHIRSEVLQSLLAGVLIYAGLRLLGVEQALLLAMLAALAWLIPLVGGVIALIILLPIAILSPLWVTVVAAALVLGVLGLMEFVVEPRLDRGRERMEIFGLIMAMIMLQLFGLLGLLVASPLAIAIGTALKTWEASDEVDATESRASMEASLRRRLATLRQLVSAQGESLPQRTRSLYRRLENVVSAAETDAALQISEIGPLPQTVDDLLASDTGAQGVEAHSAGSPA